MLSNTPVIRALCRRDFRRWFGSANGYVFLIVFVVLCTAAQFWPSEFFQSNLANLDTLNSWFPWLLLFFIPAVTMTIWAGEKGQGTDELLLTLPATDFQIAMGKYLAAVAVYTLSLLFTLPIVMFLSFLGQPDLGLIACNYFGFWLLGSTLIAAGMVGSQCSRNVTIAFVAGAIICALTLTSEGILAVLAPGWRTPIGYGPVSLFQEFGRGVFSWAGIGLFFGMTAAFLYLNLVMVSHRNWKGSGHGAHLSLRVVSLLLSATCLALIAGGWGWRADATAERVHSVSDDTRELISSLSADRPVAVQAFVSKEVPRSFVQTRRTLLNLLAEYDALGGSALTVRVVDTEPFSEEAEEAETTFGIRPQARLELESGKERQFEVYLGLAFTCGLQQVVVPFVDKGLSVEYELTRSIRTVAAIERRKIGVIANELEVFGGMNFQTMQQKPQWEIVRELKLQYEVVSVDPAQDYPEDLDALLVPMASMLNQANLDRLQAAVAAGLPTIVVDDPFPVAAPGMAPSDQKQGQPGPFGQRQPGEPKGRIMDFLKEFNIVWPASTVVWDEYNPHPQFEFDPEIVVIGANSGSTQAFNNELDVTSGLQEIITLFPGRVTQGSKTDYSFTSLLRTTQNSGDMPMGSLMIDNPFFGKQLNPRRRYFRDADEKVLGCEVRSKNVAEGGKGVHLIFLADLDMISSQFFMLRARGLEDLRLDNVTFILNCIDSLAGDTRFVRLRKRRPVHRTLTAIEKEQLAFDEAWNKVRNNAQDAAEKKLGEAQAVLDKKVAEVEARPDLDDNQKARMIEFIRQEQQRDFDRKKDEIEREKERVIRVALKDKKANEAGVQNFYRSGALALAPIPALLFGLFSFARRMRRERDTVSPSRRVGGE